MKHNFITNWEMSLSDVGVFGASARIYDRTNRIIKGEYFYRSETNVYIPISNLYPLIKNVKNKKGIIIAKRIKPEDPLLFTSQVFQKLKKGNSIYRRQKNDRVALEKINIF